VGIITTKDGTRIAYKDWGNGQPILFSHGWPLSGDAWDAQMLFSAKAAIGLLLMTGAATASRTSPGTATAWTSMPMIWPS